MAYIGNGPYQGVLTGGNIQDGTVETSDLANDAVTTVKINDGNVTTGKLADDSVTNAKIAANAVTSTEIAAGSVTYNQLQDGTITTAKLADGSVTAAKIAAGAAVPTQTGQSGKYLTTDGTTASWGTITQETASSILTKVKTVDGASSGLDADLLDGQQGSYYTGYTDTAIANLVDTAPSTLDTLNELAAALGDDPNFATTVTNSIATKLNSSSYTASDVLAKIKTVDGAGSGLNADTVDGIQASSFLRSDANDTWTGNISTTSTNGIRFGNANQTDTNDGYIAAGRFASGLNIVGTQTTSGTGRQVRVWGDLITEGGAAYLSGSTDQLCKVWAQWNGEGSVNLEDDYNVSSITDLGTGSFQVNFSSSVGTTSYCVVGASASDIGYAVTTVVTEFRRDIDQDRYNQTTYCTVSTCATDNSVARDVHNVNIAIFA